MSSALPDEPDVHLIVRMGGYQLHYAACSTAALLFIQDNGIRHCTDAVYVASGRTDQLPGWPVNNCMSSDDGSIATQRSRPRCLPSDECGRNTVVLERAIPDSRNEGKARPVDNEQMAMDLGVPVEQTEWGKWVAPDRRAAQVRKFLDHAGLRDIPSEPWPEGAPELSHLDAVVAALFPDMATAMAPENADMADAFICFLGELFIRFAGAHWEDYKWFGRENSFYDHVNPLLEYGFDADGDTAYGLMTLMIDDYDPAEGGMFSSMAEMLREFADEYSSSRDGV
ncbi:MULTISPECIES: hypothetical protein [Nocardia]|uniref:hypothetical protein n=1 Tax=Nocardia TaxID=1817 RepID=UPI00245551F8|nr:MULTISPECIES: hypothetical protein [Nocardia]